jgi:hypothetical protein
MGFLTSRVLMPIVARLGSRTIIGVGGTLFVLNMLIPDPLPLVDEFLILAGTILLSRMAKGGTGAAGAPSATGEAAANGAWAARGATGAPGVRAPKPVGRGSTQTRQQP